MKIYVSVLHKPNCYVYSNFSSDKYVTTDKIIHQRPDRCTENTDPKVLCMGLW